MCASVAHRVRKGQGFGVTYGLICLGKQPPFSTSDIILIKDEGFLGSWLLWPGKFSRSNTWATLSNVLIQLSPRAMNLLIHVLQCYVNTTSISLCHSINLCMVTNRACVRKFLLHRSARTVWLPTVEFARALMWLRFSPRKLQL